jgi:hypothetical protein
MVVSLLFVEGLRHPARVHKIDPLVHPDDLDLVIPELPPDAQASR